MALDRLRTTNSCVPTLRNDTTTARLIEGYGLQEGDKQGHQQQEQCEEQTINDPGMGPNMSKATGNRNNAAGELEEEESAGTALMPQPMKAGGVLAVLEAGGVEDV